MRPSRPVPSTPKSVARRPPAPQTAHRSRWRGQSLAELALVLPIVLVLVLVALDFGRAYLGWVVLNNAARVGANYAALHADAWDTPGDPIEQATYDSLVRDARVDAAATLAGCDSAPVPPPAFPSGKDVGDHAVVTLDCRFAPITPLIGNILGEGSIGVTARSLFPIRTGALEGPVITPPPVCPALADFSWAVDGVDPLQVDFTDTSSGSPSDWTWAFGDGWDSTLQHPSHTYASGGSYPVRLDVSGCSSITRDVTVTEPDPSSSPDASAEPSASPSPTPGCTVPSFIGTRKGDAQGTWQAAAFTTSVIFDPNPNGNWIIQAQSLVGGQQAPCNVTITLGPNPITGS